MKTLTIDYQLYVSEKDTARASGYQNGVSDLLKLFERVKSESLTELPIEFYDMELNKNINLRIEKYLGIKPEIFTENDVPF